MKKNLITLIVLLTACLSSNSQTPSTTTKPCEVPCRGLKNALKVDRQAQYLNRQLIIVRDSLGYQQSIIESYDSITKYQKIQIDTLKTNEKHYININVLKDKTIKDLNRDKKVAYFTTFIVIITSLLINL